MPLHFRSLRSSSHGNCLALWTDRTRVVIDCGLGSMRKTRQILTENLGNPSDIDAVVISHAHTDHISYYPLRVLEDEGITVRIPEDCLEQLRHKHFNEYGFSSLRIRTFSDRGFRVGDLTFKAFRLPHNPYYPTYGFVITYKKKKVVIATDFNRWQDCVEHFIDADFLFVESNHDLELLSRYYNPNSEFHLPNPETGKLLCSVKKNSRRACGAVMLGHLSLIRNETDIALGEIRNSFQSSGVELNFGLWAAPRLEASEAVGIA
jgi:ribonuclease BN (tRNA processing enzyme)